MILHHWALNTSVLTAKENSLPNEALLSTRDAKSLKEKAVRAANKRHTKKALTALKNKDGLAVSKRKLKVKDATLPNKKRKINVNDVILPDKKLRDGPPTKVH